MAVNVPGTRTRSSLVHYVVQFDENTAATHDVVAAPGAGWRIVVMGANLVGSGGQVLTFQSDLAAGSPVAIWERTLTTAVYLDDYKPAGICSCDENEGLSMALVAAVKVVGLVHYVIEAVP